MKIDKRSGQIVKGVGLVGMGVTSVLMLLDLLTDLRPFVLCLGAGCLGAGMECLASKETETDLGNS